MSNEFSMTTGQAHEVAMAFGRNGWSNEQIKRACEGDFLKRVLDVQLGYSEIKPIEHLIDFDVKPFTPNSWEVLPDSEQLPDRVKGKIKFDPRKVALYLDDGQKNGKVIEGNILRKKLLKKEVYGAQLLDFYLANPHLIPEEWKGKAIFFWGTIYRRSDGDLFVRYLYWNDGRWRWSCYWLVYGWVDFDPAAVSASLPAQAG